MKNDMIRLEEVITMIYWIRDEKVKLNNQEFEITPNTNLLPLLAEKGFFIPIAFQ